MSDKFQQRDSEQLATGINRLVASLRSRHHDADDRARLNGAINDLVERMEGYYGPQPALMAMRGRFIGNHLAGSHVDREYLRRYDRYPAGCGLDDEPAVDVDAGTEPVAAQ